MVRPEVCLMWQDDEVEDLSAAFAAVDTAVAAAAACFVVAAAATAMP